MKKTLTKRKMYQKRRKKEKEERKKIQKQQQQLLANANSRKSDATMSGNRIRNKKQKERQNTKTQNTQTVADECANDQINNPQYIPPYPSNAYMEGVRQWWHIYHSAMQQHQAMAQHFTGGNDNTEEESYEDLLERYAQEYETSTEEEDEDEDDDYEEDEEQENYDEYDEENNQQQVEIDVEYLQFMEITYKHREELRLKRAAEKLTNEVP